MGIEGGEATIEEEATENEDTKNQTDVDSCMGTFTNINTLLLGLEPPLPPHTRMNWLATFFCMKITGVSSPLPLHTHSIRPDLTPSALARINIRERSLSTHRNSQRLFFRFQFEIKSILCFICDYFDLFLFFLQQVTNCFCSLVYLICRLSR